MVVFLTSIYDINFASLYVNTCYVWVIMFMPLIVMAQLRVRPRYYTSQYQYCAVWWFLLRTWKKKKSTSWYTAYCKTCFMGCSFICNVLLVALKIWIYDDNIFYPLRLCNQRAPCASCLVTCLIQLVIVLAICKISKNIAL